MPHGFRFFFSICRSGLVTGRGRMLRGWMKWAVIQAEQENDMNILKKLCSVCAVAESMMTVNTGSRLQYNCDWGRQTSWSQMRMALSRSRSG
ncbi:hypothetical protein ECDEC4C_5314 [Escherichia coli DEC4C]|nr:hypothetical protein ECDEC4C_5314 [Escherichia coli DEC4C]